MTFTLTVTFGRSIAKPWGLEEVIGSNNFTRFLQMANKKSYKNIEIKLNKGDYIKIVTGGGGDMWVRGMT